MNKKIILSTIVLLLTIASMVILLPGKNDKKIEKNKKDEKKEELYTPALYKICDDDSCIYLLGSIHLGDSRISKLSDTIINAYKESDKIAVELDADNAQLTEEDLLANDSNRIDNVVDAETKNKIVDFFDNKLGIPYSAVENYKFSYLSTLIESFMYLKAGLSNPGVDSYFIKLAKQDNKEIIEFETYEFQMNILLNQSNEFYIKQVNNLIDTYDETFDELSKMYEAYLNGNVEDLKEFVNIDLNDESLTEEEKEYLNDLYTNRNTNMAARCEEFLNNNENVFVTVGAAHVVADGGIVDLLKDKYKIELVK